MKFKVYTYDYKINKSRESYVGRFEIYDDKGNFIAGSGKRRVSNYVPDNTEESLPVKYIKDIAGIEKRIIVTQVESTNPPVRQRSRYSLTSIDSIESDTSQTIYEVECA